MAARKTAEDANSAPAEREITPDSPLTLYAPDGRTWEASSPEEVVNLKARGYGESEPDAETVEAAKAAVIPAPAQAEA